MAAKIQERIESLEQRLKQLKTKQDQAAARTGTRQDGPEPDCAARRYAPQIPGRGHRALAR
jgi:hypothetical protein